MRVRSLLAVSAIILIPSFSFVSQANDGFDFGQASAVEEVKTPETAPVKSADTKEVKAVAKEIPQDVVKAAPVEKIEINKLEPVKIAQSANSAEDDALARAQAAMNGEVLAKPFLAERPEAVDAYIKEAMAKDLKPAEYKGTNWKKGYTCRDLLRYSWNEYRNCSYYHRYHGRYYW